VLLCTILTGYQEHRDKGIRYVLTVQCMHGHGHICLHMQHLIQLL